MEEQQCRTEPLTVYLAIYDGFLLSIEITVIHLACRLQFTIMYCVECASS